MTALENFLLYYNRLPESSTKKAILKQCLTNIHRLGELSLYELAEICYTSPATISRLVKALGYESYSAFQFSISDSVSRYDYHNRFYIGINSQPVVPKEVVMENLSYILEEFDKNVTPEAVMPLVDALHRAKHVTIFSYGILFMETTLQSDLIMSGVLCDILMGDVSQRQCARELTADDLVIFMMPDGIESLPLIKDTLEVAVKRGTKICILSSGNCPHVFRYADYVLYYHGRRYMADSFYLEMLLAVISMTYREKYN